MADQVIFIQGWVNSNDKQYFEIMQRQGYKEKHISVLNIEEWLLLL